MNRDISLGIDADVTLKAGVYEAAVNGAGVDLLGCEAATVLLQVGDFTDGSIAVSLEESDDDSTYAAVAAGDLVGAFTAVDAAGDTGTVQKVAYIGDKRYIRAVTADSGGVTGAELAAVVVKGHLRRSAGQPV